MERKPLVAIECLESEFSPWLLLEYRHASIIYGKEHIMYTNVPRRYHSILKRYGYVREESVLDIFLGEEILILDPAADRIVSKSDLEDIEVVVVGGILGDHPPKGRTRKLLSERARGSKIRGLGSGQYSIDGAVYVFKYILEKGSLRGLAYIDGLELRYSKDDIEIKINLPFRYPLVNGKPLIAPGLKEFLIHRRLSRWIVEEMLSK